ncbi:bifunctional metallophosphatase/5'-nucleotidase [Sporosarcina sp. BI001-red]|uniref:bifunctional metallophosphatase/5'-nucleotidase n=1 Tax=Sporosarcina sp. BI001-red TaxID=2282866 RepID=UPI000E274622|nr:bifunctional UDP-sugar hydrolase/5'-nucleotidase [Sporosarcina sp. BI001-red]REB07072.1 bifunctional metallophosphatase/5'-nucleotidase [Sporosarcina sp. BI001-red]
MKRISVLVTSDVHGYIMPTDFSGESELPLGLGKLATVIGEERDNNSVLLIENGDFIQGSPLTYYEQSFTDGKDNSVIGLANALHYDLAVFGNHEFNFGLPVLNKVVEESDYPWLAANIKRKDGAYFTKPYILKEIDGVNIAIVGVTTQFVPIWEAEPNIEGLIFEDAFEAAKREVEWLHDNHQVDVMIIAYHGGFECDLETGEVLESTRENVGYQICKEIDGVDVVITGHQHREIAQHLFGKAVVQPGTKGVCLGKIELTINDSGKLEKAEPSLVYMDDVPLNGAIKELIVPIHEETEKWLDKNIGKIEGDLLISSPFIARLEGHPYVEFINRVQNEVAGTSISCMAIFNDVCLGFNPNVTMRDIVTNYIFPNTLKVLQVKGTYIIQALEQSASYFTLDKGVPIVSDDFLIPKEQPFNYDLWSGIDYTIDLRNEVGRRVVEVLYNGKPLQLDDTYEVVMNNYRSTGAGNFEYFRDCPVVKDIQVDMTELIADYFVKHGTVSAKPMQNMKILYE